MIEFKTNYTQGQWSFDGVDIRSENGFLVVDCDGIPKDAGIEVVEK